MDFELIWWLSVLLGVVIAGPAIFGLRVASSNYIEDLKAWNRNYERIQRRH